MRGTWGKGLPIPWVPPPVTPSPSYVPPLSTGPAHISLLRKGTGGLDLHGRGPGGGEVMVVVVVKGGMNQHQPSMRSMLDSNSAPTVNDNARSYRMLARLEKGDLYYIINI